MVAAGIGRAATVVGAGGDAAAAPGIGEGGVAAMVAAGPLVRQPWLGVGEGGSAAMADIGAGGADMAAVPTDSTEAAIAISSGIALCWPFRVEP